MTGRSNEMGGWWSKSVVWRTIQVLCSSSTTAGNPTPNRIDGKPPWNSYLIKSALYDVVADPNATDSLFGKANMMATMRDLAAALDRW